MSTENKDEVKSAVVDIAAQLDTLVGFVELSSAKIDPRYLVRAFKEHTVIRRSLKADDLLQLIERVYPTGYFSVENLRAALLPFSSADESMDVDVKKIEIKEDCFPEVDLFVHLLVQIFLHDSGELKAFHNFNTEVCLPVLQSYNRRTLDFIQAKIWYYISRSSELTGQLTQIRAPLMSGLRSATLRHDTETRASIITLLLRNYILTNDITQAYNLVGKTEFPNDATNSVVARYYYYLARIQAIQLDYSSALECIITAIRKSPQTKSALGFLQSTTKLHIIIQLLTGEVPELKSFTDSGSDLERSLEPYSVFTKAVRLGDLKIFNEALEKYKDVLKRDKNYNLVLRLRQNVIKTGIRIISVTYKKISLKDICIKLGLENELSAEYIVSKAIADGVIEATIDHQQGFMQSKELVDVYSTTAPQAELDRRIKFTLQLNNESVKDMKYPLSKNRVSGQADFEARAREQELIAYLQDDDF